MAVCSKTGGYGARRAFTVKKKLLERIKVCIESIMMMLLPWDKKGGVQQNY